MYKKILISLTIIASVIAHGTAYANENATNPLQVLPKNLDMVFDLDMKQSRPIAEIAKQLSVNSEDAAIKKLIDIAKSNKLTAGFRGLDQDGEIKDVFMAVKITNEQFESISKFFGEASGLNPQGEIIRYMCLKDVGSCFTKLGKYFYMTNSTRTMDELIMNFKNGEMDVLGRNKDYKDTQNISVFGSTADVYLSFGWLTENLMTDFKNTYGANPLFEDDQMYQLFDGIIKSLKYESISLAMSDTRTSGRMYVKHNESIRDLPFSYLDFIFKPNLYNYVDPNNIILYVESGSLAKRAQITESSFENTFGDEVKPIIGLLSNMDGRNAFVIRYDEKDAMPKITFMSELQRNSRLKVNEAVMKLVAQMQEKIDAENAYYKEMGMENPTKTDIKAVAAGLYDITILLDKEAASTYRIENIEIKFGVNSNGVFIVSNDATGGVKHNNAETQFEKNVKGPINTAGTVFIDFKALYTYITNLESEYSMPTDEAILDAIRQLGTFTMRASAAIDSVKIDFDITYMLNAPMESVIQNLIESLY